MMKAIPMVLLILALPVCAAAGETPAEAVQKGVADLQAGRLTRAEGRFLKAQETAPESVEVQARLGDVYRRQGQFARAVPHYEKALTLDPRATEVYAVLAYVYRKSGDTQRAIETFERFVQAFPGRPEAWLGLGGVCDAAGMHDRAEAAYAAYRQLTNPSSQPN